MIQVVVKKVIVVDNNMKEVVDAIDLSNSIIKNNLFHQQKMNEQL